MCAHVESRTGVFISVVRKKKKKCESFWELSREVKFDSRSAASNCPQSEKTRLLLHEPCLESAHVLTTIFLSYNHIKHGQLTAVLSCVRDQDLFELDAVVLRIVAAARQQTIFMKHVFHESEGVRPARTA